ncbi:MAG: type II toxin-antitoxin system VapC family toxin [Rubrivivax sp.]|nr:MAG: type II toxin-antitoxin system VapC family toxin [Rubrivivax sp.]
MKLLLDTNVLSELLRASPDAGVVAWFAAQHADALFVSAVTQAEMLFGAALLPAGRRRAQLEEQLHAMFDEDFARRILAFDSDAARVYAGVVSGRRQAGRPISQFDAQIAAIALAQRASLVTRNVEDFEGCGLMLLNPFT